MLRMLFSLGFRNQLRRTRPGLIAQVENAAAAAVRAAGGKLNAGRHILSASFEEDSVGRWLDITILLEEIIKTLEKAAPELYGYTLVLCEDTPELEPEELCRLLSPPGGEGGEGGEKESPGGGGIWCAGVFEKPLSPYMIFGGKKVEGFREFKGWKTFTALSPALRFPNREKILRALRKGEGRNVLLAGREFMGKGDGLSRYYRERFGDIPALRVRFGSGGRGIFCFADAYTPEIRSFLGGGGAGVPKAALEELDALQALLFRDRLRDELSPYMAGAGRRFFRLLLETYIARMKSGSPEPVLILENLPAAAGGEAAGICVEILQSLEKGKGVLVFAACHIHGPGRAGMDTVEKDLRGWRSIFPRILKFSFEGPPRKAGDLPRDLLELAYGLDLLSRYFPPFIFPRLFEEGGLNPAMLARALDLLLLMGIIDTKEDPRPRIPNFSEYAERALGDRKEKIRFLARDRILALVASGRLRPCFNLLGILAGLGGKGSPGLILNAVRQDVLNGTWAGIEESLKDRRFEILAGKENAPALNFIFQTQRALSFAGVEEIGKVFTMAVPEEIGCPGFRAQIMANLTGYCLGKGDLAAALEMVKETMFLNQTLKDGALPAYRLFALVNMANKKVDDALEYIAFAMDQSEHQEQFDELVKASYFAAAVFFIHGNISRAERLARKAEEQAAALGNAGWADKARFLRGRFCFETGRYSRALEIFKSLLRDEGDDARRPFPKDAQAPPAGTPRPLSPRSSCYREETLSAWIYRTEVYLGKGKTGTGKKTFTSGDGLLFQAEASYLAGDYEDAVRLGEELLRRLGDPGQDFPEGDFFFTEQPDWRSGFEQCEYMLIPPKTFQTRMAAAYHSLARSRYLSSRGEREAVVGDMRHFIREGFQDDPNEAFYYYAYYRLLQEASQAQGDMNTAISIAFKRFQRRAGRVDDMEIRQSYLNDHYWNSALNRAARDCKLI
jgi:tetratricopeptide (TPR) repeat protein